MKTTYNLPTVATNDMYEDMLHQTHLLIAGTTGSGKSTVVNGIIMNALAHSPEDYRLVLIDPKRVELVEYKNLPHTMMYASEPDEMVKALERIMKGIDLRYAMMAQAGMKKWQGSKVLIIIDEMADLLTTQKNKVKPLLQRIAQIGRAANVMLIGCTQRPTSDVIGNEITCNLDARLGLRTRSAQESKNIIGENGCEKLPRYGYGMYQTPEMFDKVVLKMYTDDEREAVIRHWLNQPIETPWAV